MNYFINLEAEFEIIVFSNGKQAEPFTEWILELDSVTRKRIFAKVARLQSGNFGDCKQIVDSIYELRCFFGSGYRVYFGKYREYVVVLLCGGDKSSQSKDIIKAKQYWSNYNEQKIETKKNK
jgi:putative addiction module killer protein